MPVTVGRSGLHNLRARAQTVGGTCTVESLDEGGTRFLWSAPVSTPVAGVRTCPDDRHCPARRTPGVLTQQRAGYRFGCP